MIQNPITNNLNTLFGDSPAGFFAGLVRVAITAAFIFAAIFFIFNLLAGGIEWINSGNDKAGLENARKRVINAIVGIIIVLSTYVIVNLISAVFEVNLLVFDLSVLRVVP